MGRGLSQLQKTILLTALDSAAEQQESWARCNANCLAHGYPTHEREHHEYCATHGTHIHQRVYGCYDDRAWRDPTPAQRVTVSKAFKRLQERGLVAEKKHYGGLFHLTREGVATAQQLSANTCP